MATKMKMEDKRALYALDLFQKAWDKQDEEERLHPRKFPRIRYKPVITPQYRTIKDVILALRGYRDYASLYEVIPAIQFLLNSGWAIRPCEVCKRGAFSHKNMSPIFCATCANFEIEMKNEKEESKKRRELKRMKALIAQSMKEEVVEMPVYSVPPVTAENTHSQ